MNMLTTNCFIMDVIEKSKLQVLSFMFVSNFRRCPLPLKLMSCILNVSKSRTLCHLRQTQLEFSVKLCHMDAQRVEDGHPVDISSYVAYEENNRYAGTKICGGAPCGFSDAKTSSREAKEWSASMWKLWGGVVLYFIFMGVEAFSGIKANNLAILTDATHLWSDVAAFAILLFSVWASGWEAIPHQDASTNFYL
ncbi:putative cation efflux protein [Helianthus anomalus]